MAVIYYAAMISHRGLIRIFPKADYGLAHQIVPNNPDYLYGLVSVLISLKSFDEALHYAYQLNQLVPNNQQVQQLIQFIRYSNR
jgi:hypothetical protein